MVELSIYENVIASDSEAIQSIGANEVAQGEYAQPEDTWCASAPYISFL